MLRLRRNRRGGNEPLRQHGQHPCPTFLMPAPHFIFRQTGMAQRNLGLRSARLGCLPPRRIGNCRRSINSTCLARTCAPAVHPRIGAILRPNAHGHEPANGAGRRSRPRSRAVASVTPRKNALIIPPSEVAKERTAPRPLSPSREPLRMRNQTRTESTRISATIIRNIPHTAASNRSLKICRLRFARFSRPRWCPRQSRSANGWLPTEIPGAADPRRSSDSRR